MKVLILTIDEDLTSSYLIRWLIHYSVPFTRINLNSVIEKINLFIDLDTEMGIEIDGVKMTDFTHVIYRRGQLKYKKMAIKQFKEQVNDILNDEQRILSEFLFLVFEEKPCFGSYFKERYHNKLFVLRKATQVGLKIPKTLITTERNVIKTELFNTKLITKPIYNNFTIFYGNRISSTYTEEVINEKLETDCDYFFPSKFQYLVEKEFEIRTFIYRSRIFSTAIIESESNGKIDYRTYESNQRYVPYELPKSISNKLFELMKEINLETGSIDLIKAKDGEYYFLEVNPTGQFSALSYHCNFFIEKHIINALCQI